MTDIEVAKASYEAKYLSTKGVVAVCTKSDWENCVDCGADESEHETFELHIYIENTHILENLPDHFLGFNCYYTVVPSGYSVGCD